MSELILGTGGSLEESSLLDSHGSVANTPSGSSTSTEDSRETLLSSLLRLASCVLLVQPLAISLAESSRTRCLSRSSWT